MIIKVVKPGNIRGARRVMEIIREVKRQGFDVLVKTAKRYLWLAVLGVDCNLLDMAIIRANPRFARIEKRARIIRSARERGEFCEVQTWKTATGLD